MISNTGCVMLETNVAQQLSLPREEHLEIIFLPGKEHHKMTKDKEKVSPKKQETVSTTVVYSSHWTLTGNRGFNL